MSTSEDSLRKAAVNADRSAEYTYDKSNPYADIWFAFLKFKWAILILVVVLAVGGYLYTKSRFVPMYTSSATFTVNTRSTTVSQNGLDEYSFYYTLNTAEKLSRAFPSILSSNILQSRIMEDLGIGYMPATISASTVSGSNLFTVTVRGANPEMVYKVLQSTIKNLPSASKHVLGGIRLQIISIPDGIPTDCDNKSDALKSAATGAGIGLLLGFMWVLLFVWFRKTIRGRNDIRKNFNLETLGTLPVVTFKKYKTEIDRSVLITNKRVSSDYKESVRVLRNTVVNKLQKGENVLLITGTAPGEGKTSVSCNIALALADVGKKVLLIDADLRKPNVNSSLGLTDEEPDIRVDDPVYTIAYAGRLKLNVLNFKVKTNRYWKIMDTAYLHPLIEQLRGEYDYILIDTPPCGLISDPIVISQEVDAALYVILQDTIRTSRIRNSILTLASADVRILGCVLNGAFADGVGYGYGYGYNRYGYGYGKYGYGKYGYGHYGYGKSYGRYGHNGRYGYGDGYSSRVNEELSVENAGETSGKESSAAPEVKE